MKKFISGKDVNPFYKASQATIDVLESAPVSTLALAVPYVKITEVDPYTGIKLPKSAFTLDLVSAPGFARTNRDGYMLERPLVSLESINVVGEPLNGMSFYNKVSLSFTVHDPYSVFYADDDLSTFRSILQEGTSFLLEYGWHGNCDNDLLNGIGYFDEKAGFVVPAVKSARIVIYSWKASVGTDSSMKLTVDAIQDGELAFREAKLSTFLSITIARKSI